ncbi:MAG: TlpA disulfide reductase family protein [Burkholderiales bacterium]|jgi:thiol-disulfide isomerase/thioredoxin
MKRRHFLPALMGLTAGAGGISLFVFHEKRRTEQARREAKFWRLEFLSPEGRVIALSQFKGRPLLLNFWATWCPPCLKEMPLLSHFQRNQGSQGWQVLGLAIDAVPPVKAYLKQNPMEFDIGIAGFDGLDLAFELGNSTRQLPFSVLFNREGTVIGRQLGVLTAPDLAQLQG